MTGFLFGGGAGTTVTATGTTTARNLADRCAEIFNVKDFGALGDNSHDDTSAINAAVDAAARTTSGSGATNAGTVFFPPGTYKTTASIQNNFGGNVELFGSGKHASCINGNFAGFTVNSNLDDGNHWNADPNTAGFISSISRLYIKNTAALNANLTGAVRFSQGSSGGAITHCDLQGSVACDAASNSFSSIFFDVDFRSFDESAKAGTVGVYSGQNGFYNCSFTTFGQGARLFGIGTVISGCRFETNLLGIMVGMDPTGASRGLSGATITANSYERNEVGIYVLNLASGIITSQSITGTRSVAHGMSAMSYSAGTGLITATSVQTLDSYGWTSGTRQVLIESALPAEYNTAASTFVTCTRTGTNTFTYAPAGAAPGTYVGSGTWSFKIQYGMRVSGMQFSTLSNINCPTSEVAGIDLDAGGSGTGTKNQLKSVIGGTWIVPRDINKASYTMAGCDTASNFGMTFACLPGAAGVSEATAIEGMTYDLTDCNTSTFLATAAAGGSGSTAHRRVRYNASAALWQVIG